jgi:hypothetical protein
MKSRKLTCVAAVTFVVLAITVRLAAQNKQDHHHKYHHYKLVDLGTFGGPNSSVSIEPDQNVSTALERS